MLLTKRQGGENGREYALRTIRENIINLELKPGVMLSEKDLAEEMGLSRTPVREALMDLAQVKIVEVLPQRGSRIALIDYRTVEDFRFTRNLLECAVVELASRMAKPEDVKALEENVMLEDFNLHNPEKLMQLDDEFHGRLFAIAEKMQTYQMLRSYGVHFDRVRNMSLYAVKDIKIVEDHRQIAQAMAEHNGWAAREIMEKHLSRYKVDEKGIRENYPVEYFAL